MSVEGGELRDPGMGCLTRRALSILRGQLISLLIGGTGIFATLLSSATPNANFPQFMNFLNYLLLSGYFLRRTWLLSATASHDLLATSSVSKALRQEEHKDEEGKVDEAQESGGHDAEGAAPATIATGNQTVHFGWYVLAAFLDVNGNFLFIKAYDYTSITSIMILDCFTIPSAMLLSCLFLSVRYTLTHLLGIVICVSGLVCIVVSDLRDSKSSAAGSNQFLGDMMCIMGSILYASSNVLQEHLVRKGLREEYMGNVGVCGIVMAGVQFIALELPRMQRTAFSSQDVLAICGFVGCLFFMYTNTSSFLEKSDAVLFNLSLLTSDVYAVVFSFFFYGHLVPWIYFLSYALVCIGLYIYYRIPPSSGLDSSGATINEAYNPLAGAGGSVQ